MLNPRVGDIEDISSPTSLFRIVVFPALSSPLRCQHIEWEDVDVRCGKGEKPYRNSTLISFDLALFFLIMVRSPVPISILDYQDADVFDIPILPGRVSQREVLNR